MFSAVAIKEKSTGRASRGLAIILKKNYQAILIESSDSWIFLHSKSQHFEAVIACVYFRPVRDINILLELFQYSLEEIACSHEHLPLLLLGDFNARLGHLNTLSEEITDGTSLNLERKSMNTVINYREIQGHSRK